MKKTWKSLLAVSAMTAMLFSMTACNKQGGDKPSVTPEPTATDVPAEPTIEPTAEPTLEPTPTEAPSSEPVIIHNIAAEKKRDTLYFGSRGSGVAFWANTFGKDSEGSVQVTSRGDTWHGVSLSFTDATYTAHDVTGKEVFVSFDVYQESGAPMTISCTLQVNKPDGSQGWPERVSEEIPSGEWTHLEGIIPVYANALAPSLNFESPDNAKADFYLDNVIVSYNPASSVDPNPDYEPAEKLPFENFTTDFSDGTTGVFGARGDATPSVVDGAMYVTGRTANWNGAQADFTAYDLAGKNITVSFKAKHDEAAPIAIKASLEEKDGTQSTYATIAGCTEEETVAPGEWVEYTGTYTVLDTTVAGILYFEATDTASFYIDDVTVTVE